MGKEGLVEIMNPSGAFCLKELEACLARQSYVSLEGTRPMLVEVQALASTTALVCPEECPPV